jgi:nucleoside triphosphate diphosphatase
MNAPDHLARLSAIMTKLRDPLSGCPWDMAQDFASIAPYTIEEAYEVAQAIDDGDMGALCEELGDLQLQVVYHAQMAAETGAFALPDVIAGICDKMERRHPHIFGDDVVKADAVAQKRNWEALKAAEKPRNGVLDGIAAALPALMRAEKLQARAAQTGFDWPDANGPRDKIVEEVDEFDSAPDFAARVEEAGDLLFAVVNFVRHHGVDAEAALRAANAKFERRFNAMEAKAMGEFATLDLDAQEALWQAVKVDEQR